jgi:hypothetical protein
MIGVRKSYELVLDRFKVGKGVTLEDMLRWI